MKKYLAILLLILTGCVQDPEAPIADKLISGGNCAYVICEGLWHYDNSTIERYVGDSNAVIKDIYGIVNAGLKLGDLANGATIYGDYMYVVMTTPAMIEKIELKSGRSVGQLCIEPESDPRKIAVVNENLAYVTCLRTHSVRAFNPTTMEKLRLNIAVGPAPEGLDFCGNYVFVANSGYGDFMADQPKAGTVSVINAASAEVLRELECGTNVIEIKANRNRNRVYAMYYNLPSLEDSLGGIVEYDAETLRELRRVRLSGRAMNLTQTGDTLIYVNDSGAYMIDLYPKVMTPVKIVSNPTPSEHWYSATVSPDNRLFVGNAKNYMMLGDLMIYEFKPGGNLISKLTIGINPNTILFY